MRWGTKTIAGVDYDLGHLDGFDMSVTPKVEAARTYIVRVSFGCHTFTRDLTDADTPDLQFRYENELRCFCTERYAYSLDLPDMIRYAAGGRVYFSEREFPGRRKHPGSERTVRGLLQHREGKEGGRLRCGDVCHERPYQPGLPDKLPAVTFRTLVDYRVQGKKLTRPEPRKVIAVKRK